MAVAASQIGDQGLAPDSFRISLAGPLGGLSYPRICPNCGDAASALVAIPKVFAWNQNDGGGDGGPGWQYHIAEATPFFCPACRDRHRVEQRPVTSAEKLRSMIFTELALPAVGALALGSFLFAKIGAKIVRDPAAEWLPAGVIGVLLLIGVMCLRAAWTASAHRRIPPQTETSLAFDFGDDQSTAFQTLPRTYAFRRADYAAAFTALNADRSRQVLGPEQRRRETIRTVLVAVIILVVVAAGWWFGRV